MEETDEMTITVEELLQEQADDPFCKQAAEAARQPDSQYDHDHYGFQI